MVSFLFVSTLATILVLSNGSPLAETEAAGKRDVRHVLEKRGTLNYGFNGQDFGDFPIQSFVQQPWERQKLAPSPAEVTAAVAVAKHASANVMIAQQQMQAARENLLAQQRVAASAAKTVVLAQQRLAATKSNVAHQQRLAAAKEAHAAAAIQSAAHAAAAEIQRAEHEEARNSHPPPSAPWSVGPIQIVPVTKVFGSSSSSGGGGLANGGVNSFWQ